MAGMFPIDFAFNRDFQKCMDILVAAGASAQASGATKLDPERKPRKDDRLVTTMMGPRYWDKSRKS